MSAREHEVDRIARAMCAGAPAAGFTARVMAPIHGRPQPGFTGRVMTQIDRPRARRRVGALQAALAATGALVLIAALWPPDDVALPATPMPTLVDARVGEPAFTVPVSPFTPFGTPRPEWRDSADTAAASRSPAPAAIREVERPLYQIAELDRPAGLSIRAIADAPPAVAPLGRPPALSVPELRFEKEKP